MVALGFRCFADTVCEGQRLGEVPGFIDTLQAFDAVAFDDLPSRHLWQQGLDLIFGQGRHAAPAGHTIHLC